MNKMRREQADTRYPNGGLREPSEALRSFFRSNLNRWTDFYKRTDIWARIYQERQATAVRYAEALNLPAGSLVLDAGCGPGLTSASLAQKGYVVHALDFLHEMAAAARELGRDMEAGDRVQPTVGDATRLPFTDCVFDLVVMLGVTEWVAPLDSLVGEAARVIKPGGHLIIAWNNRWSLHLILNPTANPLLATIRRRVRGILERRGWISPSLRGYLYSLRNFRNVLRLQGLTVSHVRGIGFGPFGLLRWNVVPEKMGQRLNSQLQKLADHRVPFLQAAARNYVAVARKLL